MKRIFIVGLTLSLLSTARAEAIPLSKAAELGIHRIERLVTLNKIDGNFVNHFSGISAESLTHNAPTDPAFKASGLQVPGADGKSHEVDIFMDVTGKALSYTVINGSDSVSVPTWPDKDPVSLGEDSMHYILDNAPTTPALQPFYASFTSLALTQGMDANGRTMSRATIRSSATNLILEIFLNFDGTFSSYNIH